MRNSLIIILLLPLASFSQDWLPINPADTYNYAIDTVNYASHTIWVDSVEQKDDRTVYYLNRIIAACDTCYFFDSIVKTGSNSYLIKNYPFPVIALLNQPQFLQRRIETDDKGNIWFKDYSNLLLKTNSKIGDQWYYDSSKMILAKYIDTRTQKIFDNIDSIKVFLLSGGDSIILSKNHGIIYFTEFREKTNNYRLIGIQNRSLGEKLPTIEDIFNFNIDDRFQYEYIQLAPSYRYYSFLNYIVRNKNKTLDSAIYDVEGFKIKSREAQFYPYYSFDTFYYSGVVGYKLKEINISNTTFKFLYNNGYSIDDNNQWETVVYRTYIRRPYPGMPYRFIFTGYLDGSINESFLYQVYFDTTTNKNTDILIPYNPFSLILSYYEYWEGIGKKKEIHADRFEESSSLILKGYIKDGIQHGTIDNKFYNVSENQVSRISIYPNPVKNIIGFRTDQLIQVKIIDMSGKELVSKQIDQFDKTIDVSHLTTGTYIIEIKTQESIFRQKFIKL